MNSKHKQATDMADVLRRAVLDSPLTVAALARGAGIPQPVLHRFAHGESNLSLRNAQKLGAYLGLELRPRGKGEREKGAAP